MSIRRIKQYPFPRNLDSPESISTYLQSLYRALQEEATERIVDFSLLEMADVPWVDVRTYGAKGDGETDDTKAIQAAIDSLKVNGGTYTKGAFQYRYSLGRGGGLIYFPPNYTFLTSAPLSVETDHSDTSNRMFADNIVLYGPGATLKAASTFTGASRYYDASNTETINAMVILGIKSYGKYPGHYQTYNSIIGLAFDGVDVTATDLSAIRGDVVLYPLITDCIFADLHKAIDGRVISLATISGCRATYVNSFYCAINNSEALGWNSGQGLDSGGPKITDVIVHFSKNTSNDAQYTSLGKIHLNNVGEELVENVKIMGGGGKGIYRDRTATTYQHSRWGHYNNVEIAGIYYHAVHIKNMQQINFANCQFIWNQAQTHDSTARPIVYLEDVKRIQMSNISIDQNCSPASYNCGQLIALKGGGCIFTGIQAFGLPDADNTYGAITIQDGSAGYEGDHNIFTGVEAGNTYYTAGNQFKYGIWEGAGVDSNIYSNTMTLNCATAGTNIVGAASLNTNNISV